MDNFDLRKYLAEGRLFEEGNIDISVLDKLDDEIKKALEAASKEEAPTNEIVGLTTVALVIAIPGIVNAITKVIKVLAQKSGIQLKKELFTYLLIQHIFWAGVLYLCLVGESV